jgi:hypothetical protein
MTKNEFKTWLRRNGFKGEGSTGNRTPLRKIMQHCVCVRSGRRFRFHMESNEVDIGEPFQTFDRWANSTEETVSLEDFMNRYKKGK